jgi:hypothetical protein
MNNDGVPLEHYLQHAGCGVRVHCRSCHRSTDYALEDVIAQLEARGVNGRRLGIKQVSRYVDKPCPRCGARDFATSPAFGSPALAARRQAESR